MVRYDGALLVRLLRYFVGGSARAGPECTPQGVPALQRTAFEVALESGPYAEVCRAWPVSPPSQQSADVGTSDVPVPEFLASIG